MKRGEKERRNIGETSGSKVRNGRERRREPGDRRRTEDRGDAAKLAGRERAKNSGLKHAAARGAWTPSRRQALVLGAGGTAYRVGPTCPTTRCFIGYAFWRSLMPTSMIM